MSTSLPEEFIIGGSAAMNESKTKEQPVSESGELNISKTGSMLIGEGLRQCEICLDEVLESLPYPFYVIDVSDYTIRAANPAAHFGPLSSASTCYALTHNMDKPCGSAAHPCPIEEIRKTGKPVTVEHVHCDKGGKPTNVEVHAFPVFDNQGKVSQIIEYVLDITERKQAEDALRWELSVNAALAQLYEPLVSPGASIETVARVVLEQAKTLTGSKHGYVSEIHPTTGDNVSHTLTDMLQGHCRVSEKKRKIIFPRGKDGLYPALWGHSLNTGEAFYTNSPEEHKSSSGIPEGHLPIRRFLSAPVMLGEELAGQIALANKDEDYTDRELEAICRLSEYYALAIQRKRAEDGLQKAHDELERRVEERTAELMKSYEEKAFIRETFGTYLSDEIVTELLASPEGIKLGGEMRDMTILVSDLRGFTHVTESMEASGIVKIINQYLEKMVPIIMRHGGTINEYTGDGILVFFGAPHLLPDHSSRAVVCALEMQESMKELNKENQRLGLTQVEMGIAISCGQLVVGNIGSERRRKYGAVGSPINVAFRLVEKARPGEIVVTQSVKDRLGDKLQTLSHWKDSLKGIGSTLIYQVIGMKED
jgi:class 3 adenylate cyclase